jgi:hypothetical protein
MLKLLIFVGFMLLVLLSAGHTVAMPPIPPEIRTIVAFVFVMDKDGKAVPNGTAFFVGVKDSEKSGVHHIYLVTAKHVLQNNDAQSFRSRVYIRLNKKEKGADLVPLDLVSNGPRKNVFVHKDVSVDLAVIRGTPDDKIFDFKFLPSDFITTKEDFKNLRIREGSEIFFTGLFQQQFSRDVGKQRNLPIARFGRVALVTDERIDWDGVSTELYLVESSAYGGNSGSPVFFYLGAEREPDTITIGAPVLKLAGTIMGYFGERRPIEFMKSVSQPVQNQNVGIAAVVPAYKLHDILFGDELQNLRR